MSKYYRVRNFLSNIQPNGVVKDGSRAIVSYPMMYVHEMIETIGCIGIGISNPANNDDDDFCRVSFPCLYSNSSTAWTYWISDVEEVMKKDYDTWVTNHYERQLKK